MEINEIDLVTIGPEINVPEFPEPACGANFRGGLGLLLGDVMEGLAINGVPAVGIVPLYERHWLTGEKVDYDKTPTSLAFRLLIPALQREVNVRSFDRGGVLAFGIEVPGILYTGDRDRRFEQELLIEHAAPLVLERIGERPRVVWLQESHIAVTIPVMKTHFPEAKFVFTTHTPVPAGMETFFGHRFPDLKIGEEYREVFLRDGLIDKTRGAMKLADAVTAVSLEHGEVTRRMFPEFADKIVGIINGSSRNLWLSPRIKALESVDALSLWAAHQVDKTELLSFIKKESGVSLDAEKPLLGFVRRLASYKRQYPVLAPIISALVAKKGEIVDTEFGRLEGLGFSVFAAGRAHESDGECMDWMGKFTGWTQNSFNGKFVFLPNYNLELLQKAAFGCCCWLSCPEEGQEACGTSDQRSAKNGNINLATFTGGPMEYIKEYNPITCEGTGCFINPMDSFSVYQKAKLISDLYYNWLHKRDSRWLNLRMNIFEDAKLLDITGMISRYQRIFNSI
jgi:glucan phosphorylase